MGYTRHLILVLGIYASVSWGCTSTPFPVDASKETPDVLAQISEKTDQELIQLLENSNDLNTESPVYNFSIVIDELERRGSAASEAAPTLARAIAYERRDSVIASDALIAMGPSASSAIPYLLKNLDNDREEVRRYSIFVLGIIGKPASCAVPQVAPFLWDSEPTVRSTTAGAMTEIVQEELVEFDDYKLDPTIPGGVFLDEPEGHISGIAREWWLKTGQHMNWPTKNCKPPSP